MRDDADLAELGVTLDKGLHGEVQTLPDDQLSPVWPTASRSVLNRAGWFRGRAAHAPWVALLLAAFRVDTPMLTGGSPATWHGWVHAIAFLLIIATGVLAPLTMALAVRGDPSWQPIAVVSVAASALFIVFLILPWGNATFLLAIITLFGWAAALAAPLATHHP